MPKSKAKDFEAAMGELSAIVTEMEKGDLPLEAALKRFEQGVALTRQCQKQLDSAEQKIKQLVADDEELADFSIDDEDLE